MEEPNVLKRYRLNLRQTNIKEVPNPATGSLLDWVSISTKIYGDLHFNGTDGVVFYTRCRMLTAQW